MKYLLIDERGLTVNGIEKITSVKIKEIELPDDFFQKLKTAYDFLIEEQKAKEEEND